eukprot:34783_1
MVLKGIDCGLFKVKQRRRAQFRIYIDVLCDKWVQANKFVSAIRSIVNRLEASATKDFMFIWHLHECNERLNDYNLIFEKLCNHMSTDSKVFHMGNTFVTNKIVKSMGIQIQFVDQLRVCILSR